MAQPKAGLTSAVDGLLDRIKTTPSALRLSYLLKPGEDIALARNRLREMERLIQSRWKGRGRYKLIVEKTIKRVK